MLANSIVAALLIVTATTTAAALAALESRQDPAKPAPVAKREADDLKKLSWISGTWAFERDGVMTEEHWRPLQGSTLMGSSHTFDAETTHFFEHLRITARKGTIAYIASPGGAQPTAFLMTEIGDGMVVFENPQHDHPQRIRYEKTENGLTATVGQVDGTRQERFVFERR